MKNSSSLTIVTYSEFLSDLIVSTTSFRGEIKVAVVDLTIFLFLSKNFLFSSHKHFDNRDKQNKGHVPYKYHDSNFAWNTEIPHHLESFLMQINWNYELSSTRNSKWIVQTVLCSQTLIIKEKHAFVVKRCYWVIRQDQGLPTDLGDVILLMLCFVKTIL